MAKISLDALMEIDGVRGAALVAVDSGLALAHVGMEIDVTVVAAKATEVYKKVDVAKELGMTEEAEDILISYTGTYHIIRPLHEHKGEFFIFLDLDRKKANLALARHELKKFEASLDFS